MRGAAIFSTRMSIGVKDLPGLRNTLRDSPPALVRLVKRSPNELLCGTSSFIYLVIFWMLVRYPTCQLLELVYYNVYI